MDFVDLVDVDEMAAVHAYEPVGIEALLERFQRRAQGKRAGSGSK